jgi:hypothetical protein
MKMPMNKWIKYGKYFFFLTLILLLTGPAIPDLVISYRLAHGSDNVAYFLLVALGTLITVVPPILSFSFCIYGLLHMDKKKENGRRDAIIVISLFSIFFVFAFVGIILSLFAQ